LTIRVVAYDNRMVEVDGIPINTVEDGYDRGEGWLGVAEVGTATLAEFRRQFDARQRGRKVDATTEQPSNHNVDL
jgi:hypothetical protein